MTGAIEMKSVLSDEIQEYLEHSSWIRQMFEKGIELKKIYGDNNVYDFSLGNPDVPPPENVKKALQEITQSSLQPFSLGYMSNAGYMETRSALAKKVSEEQSADIDANQIVVSCGAAGGLNCVFRAIIQPGDEVICPAPYFVEYGFYVSNYGATLHPVPSNKDDFSLDITAIKAAITNKTRAFIINSPNNPTGRIYSKEELSGLAAVLKEKSEEYQRPILLVSDEPYRFLNFDNLEIPSIFNLYNASVIIGSFSKNLSLAGERLGYIAVSKDFPNFSHFIAAVTMANRILGFVNAPCIGQKILNKCINDEADMQKYCYRRNLMADVLQKAGLEFYLPPGAFYFFPKSPIADDTEFCRILVEERVLAVPGTGFGLKGFLRFAFCVNEKTITEALPSIKHAVQIAKK